MAISFEGLQNVLIGWNLQKKVWNIETSVLKGQIYLFSFIPLVLSEPAALSRCTGQPRNSQLCNKWSGKKTTVISGAGTFTLHLSGYLQGDISFPPMGKGSS